VRFPQVEPDFDKVGTLPLGFTNESRFPQLRIRRENGCLVASFEGRDILR
jgi:hypothetical protein